MGTGPFGPARSGWRARLGFVVWVGVLVAGTSTATRTGAGMLVPPPLAPDAWAGWLASRDPFVAVMALLRVVAVGLLWYLTAATLFGAAVRIGVAVHMRASAGVLRVVDVVTPALLRRLLEGAFGVSVATALVASPIVVPPAAAQPPMPVVLDRADLPAADEPLVPRGDPFPKMLADLLARDVDADVATDVEANADGAPGAEVDDSEVATEHVVSAGESFWSIASYVLTGTLGRRPSDAEVASYWRRLVDANRGRLVDADNPDLIFPEQVFHLPLP